jgi:hypothetical protein
MVGVRLEGGCGPCRVAPPILCGRARVPLMVPMHAGAVAFRRRKDGHDGRPGGLCFPCCALTLSTVHSRLIAGSPPLQLLCMRTGSLGVALVNVSPFVIPLAALGGGTPSVSASTIARPCCSLSHLSLLLLQLRLEQHHRLMRAWPSR